MIDALHLMDEQEVSQLPVEQNGIVTGVIAREHVLRYARFRLDIDAADRAGHITPNAA